MASSRRLQVSLTGDSGHLHSALLRERNEVDRQILANQKEILRLAGQGDEIVSAVVAAASGGLGSRVGLQWQAHLQDDRTLRASYVDRDLSRWRDNRSSLLSRIFGRFVAFYVALRAIR